MWNPRRSKRKGIKEMETGEKKGKQLWEDQILFQTVEREKR